MDIETLHQLFNQSTGVSTDTRNITPGCIFFALKGDNFNGNEFAIEAINQGAFYAVIDEPCGENKQLIPVANVLETLQDLAHFHRMQLDIPIIGITGSNGKTTTKELMRDVLAKKYKTLATKGNLNNHIGVPLTLLALNSSHEIAIIEMGANHLKEIALLSSIASPDYGLITNIGTAHIGEFGGFENIIAAKTELFDHLRMVDGIAFVDSSSEILVEQSTDLEVIIYGTKPTDDTKCNLQNSDPFLSLKWNDRILKTQLIGSYNLSNVCAAIAVGTYFNVSDQEIISAIENYLPDNNRSQLTLRNGHRIIMDAYNANPSSMKAALENFQTMKSVHKLAILGDMLELGDESGISHREIMDLVAQFHLKAIFVGPEFTKAASSGELTFENTKAAQAHVKAITEPSSLVLIKGSRGIKLESLLDIF